MRNKTVLLLFGAAIVAALVAAILLRDPDFSERVPTPPAAYGVVDFEHDGIEVPTGRFGASRTELPMVDIDAGERLVVDGKQVWVRADPDNALVTPVPVWSSGSGFTLTAQDTIVTDDGRLLLTLLGIVFAIAAIGFGGAGIEVWSERAKRRRFA